MCILKEVGRFIKNGASTFRDASQGHYKQNSEAISEIRKEILEKDRNRNDDKRNLRVRLYYLIAREKAEHHSFKD